MFLNCAALKSIDLSNVNFKSIIFSSKMFSGCTSLTSIHLANFEKIDTMDYMFEDCSSLKSLKFTNFKTGRIKKMLYMFRN